MNRPMGGRAPRSDGGVQWLKALLLIFVLVILGVVILAKSGGSTKTAGKSHPTTTIARSTTTVAAPVTTTTVLPAAQVKVQVLNGLRTGSLAGKWTNKLKTQYGYVTEPPDDATVRTTTSVIYILTPGYQAEAQQLANTVGLSPSAVDLTVPPPATAPIPATELHTANLVLVVGEELAQSAGTG
ncbi:MAG TPA: LytR C-terminal domain-containing protein [Acidimicrobiales bacterium]|nr:LytR C-terminal domain-containing protein [Acidimicrobiales bacterium]